MPGGDDHALTRVMVYDRLLLTGHPNIHNVPAENAEHSKIKNVDKYKAVIESNVHGLRLSLSLLPWPRNLARTLLL